MAYRVSIDTNRYIDKRCSKKNWESGTMNDFMHAINGWKVRENSLKEVYWRIEYFAGRGGCVSEEEKDKYSLWLLRYDNKNKITYMDNLCGFKRTSKVEAYGFHQGYFDIQQKIDILKENGIVKIPFKSFYDSRQYCRNLDGCYLIIEKV